MERNERLKAADKCASRYTDENEARVARVTFMLGCEFEAQGEVVKGVILESEERLQQGQQEVKFEDIAFLLNKVKYMSGLWVKTNPDCVKIINCFNERLNARKEDKQ